MSGRTELPSGLVTFMFTDIEGSTRLARMLGDSYGAVLGAHRDVLRAALCDFGGVELFTEGDSFFVAFGDAVAAVAACVAAQRALAARDWPSPDATPRVRMGLHTGWAVPAHGEYASAEVHRAARVAAAAHGGQVLCSQATALATFTWSRELTAVASGAMEPFRPPDRPATADIALLDLGAHRLRGFDDSERLFQIVAPGLERDFPRPRTPGAASHNLPAPVTAFVGRRAELTELTALVATCRLVTVVGPGGSGKTRLALEVAERLLIAYPDGVWVVDAAALAPGAGQTALADAVARTLGMRREPGRTALDTLAERCADQRMLLVLDTCDAVPVAAATVTRMLLSVCPELDVLATSREPLGAPGEVLWRISPLHPADTFALLSERAVAARGGRAIPDAEAADLARVAARLEGSPLAAELAACRLRLLSGGQLAARLDNPLTTLDGRAGARGRHASLTASLDWSHRTLGDDASQLLRRLAVFAGPVELSTVEWCGADALGALSELADKSLVEVLPGPRYQLSAPVRRYATERLAQAGDERAARDRHVAWSMHTLDGVLVDTDGQPRTVSLTELAPYVDEWLAAARWSATGGSARAGLRLVRAIDPWWREHGGARTGRDLLFRLYERTDVAYLPPDELASAYLVHAGLAEDRDERDRFLTRAEEVARGAGNPGLLVRALAGRRITLLENRQVPEAEQLCREVLARAERSGVPGAALPAVFSLAELLWRRNRLDEVAGLLGGARQVEAGQPDERGRRTVDWLLGLVALRRGDLVAAHDHLVVALRSRLRHGFRGAAADAIAAIAVRCAMGGDAATAATLFGGAELVRGVRRTAMAAPFWAEQQAALRSVLGDAEFDTAYADGAGRGFDRIVAMALAVEHPDLEPDSARFAPTLR
ncbi:MAG TPA: adenylate/guanylate cyclase domain-containing protein [Actinoplanes sp.]|nr:adenylate/guanylate cyclase domain-containing protein [Actinoplanes sp.]